MTILGIDPGIGITGWSILAAGRPAKPELIAAGIISTTPNTPTHERLVTLYRQIGQVLEQYSPSVLSIERLFFAKNVTTAMAVSQARGVVLLAAAQAALTVHEYTPLQVKMTITGFGQASKRQVAAMLPHHVAGAPIPKQDDAADAVAIAVTHLSALRLEPVRR